jgi:hypothetical protein
MLTNKKLPGNLVQKTLLQNEGPGVKDQRWCSGAMRACTDYGEPRWIRTIDLLIKSQLLYH